MDENNPIWSLLLTAAATWPLTRALLARAPFLGTAPGFRSAAHGRSSLPAASGTRIAALAYEFSLWFSLPLQMFVSFGWLGLLLHWNALTGGNQSHTQAALWQQAAPVASSFDGCGMAGDAACVPIESE